MKGQTIVTIHTIREAQKRNIRKIFTYKEKTIINSILLKKKNLNFKEVFCTMLYIHLCRIVNNYCYCHFVSER